LTRIATILPKGEGFSPAQFGAIALCVRDFTCASRHRDDTLVIGGVPSKGFDSLRYETPAPARWYENRTRAYGRGCAAIIRRDKIELAEIHNRPLLLRLIGSEVSCRLALHLHNDPQEMDEAKTPAERMKLLARCDGVYCVSGYIRDRFLEGLPKKAGGKLHVVHNGIEMPAALQPKENRIVFAGRLTEGKGALLLAIALRIALPQLPGWHAVMIGSRRHEAGRSATPHEKQIASTLAPLGSQVTLAGFLPHPETLAHFARAAVAIVPSVWAEPFGRTALEAMAYGCAVISSGRGGLQEVTGEAAYKPGEMKARSLAAAIYDLATDAPYCEQLQTASRVQATKFDIARCARTLDEARDSILMGGARNAA
jgi:glycosyltransferase involved in cell wall biosynthesis